MSAEEGTCILCDYWPWAGATHYRDKSKNTRKRQRDKERERENKKKKERRTAPLFLAS